MNRARQVLAGGQIDRGLPADAAVDHGQQRGRHLDKADAAHPGCGGETGDIANRTTTERDQGTLPVDAGVRQRLVDGREHAELFGRLARRHQVQARRDGVGCERIDQRLGVSFRDRGIGDNDDAPTLPFPVNGGGMESAH